MSAQPSPSPRRLLVVGQGAAGLCAVVSALGQARRSGLNVQITVLDAASEADSGGNSRWSPSNIRLQANHQMAPGFVDEVMAESEGLADPDYFQQLVDQAPAMADWLVTLGITFLSPPYYLAKGPARIQPQGGGAALLQALRAQAQAAGVDGSIASPSPKCWATPTGSPAWWAPMQTDSGKPGQPMRWS